MPEQLTLRLRKPGVILLTGDPAACEAVRAALEALGPGFRCEVWYAPDAPRELQEAVARWDGEVWTCGFTAEGAIHVSGPHGFAVVLPAVPTSDYEEVAADEAVRQMLGDPS